MSKIFIKIYVKYIILIFIIITNVANIPAQIIEMQDSIKNKIQKSIKAYRLKGNAKELYEEKLFDIKEDILEERIFIDGEKIREALYSRNIDGDVVYIRIYEDNNKVQYAKGITSKSENVTSIDSLYKILNALPDSITQIFYF